MNRLFRNTFVFLLGFMATVSAAPPDAPANREPDKVIHLWREGDWKGELPDGWKTEGAEINEPTGHMGGIITVKNISDPVLSYFAPDKAKTAEGKGKGIIICPGGGYNILAWDLEGTEIATWLSGLGYHAWVLKYRLPRPGTQDVRHLAALQDAQRALSLVRSQAKETGLNPDQLGIMGFSAGGHLAAMASLKYNERSYTAKDAIDAVSCRPSFTVLIYAAYLVKDNDSKMDPEYVINASTPPAFLSHAADDPIPCRTPIEYFLALKKNNIPAELHIWPDGGHGYGLRSTLSPKAWPDRLADWLTRQGEAK
ncbi:MAG: alpha/beta hydrolase [Verrucomicrobiaceae bacterium]|nr:MAG: alpha/beta hydrolase [Verrucomicrobiaceae bacterium]